MPASRSESQWGRSMGRLRHGVPMIVLLLTLGCAGCGGGSSSFTQPPPPPAADFSLGFSTTSVSILQGATSSAINISVNAFNGSVQVALSALPAGVTSSPLSPFTVAAGATVPILIGAAANAATGNFTVSAQGTSGGLSHGTNLALTIQGAAGSTLSRTAYARTDSTSAADNLFGEPHHRHMAYDAVNKHLFVANRVMNRVEIFSHSTNPALPKFPLPAPVAQISPPMAPQ